MARFALLPAVSADDEDDEDEEDEEDEEDDDEKPAVAEVISCSGCCDAAMSSALLDCPTVVVKVPRPPPITRLAVAISILLVSLRATTAGVAATGIVRPPTLRAVAITGMRDDPALCNNERRWPRGGASLVFFVFFCPAPAMEDPPCIVAATSDHGANTGAGASAIPGVEEDEPAALLSGASPSSVSLTSMSMKREQVRVMALKPEGPD